MALLMLLSCFIFLPAFPFNFRGFCVAKRIKEILENIYLKF